MRLLKGTPVMLVGEVFGDAQDARHLDERGYVILTHRGQVYVDPQDLFVRVSELNKLQEGLEK